MLVVESTATRFRCLLRSNLRSTDPCFSPALHDHLLCHRAIRTACCQALLFPDAA